MPEDPLGHESGSTEEGERNENEARQRDQLELQNRHEDLHRKDEEGEHDDHPGDQQDHDLDEVGEEPDGADEIGRRIQDEHPEIALSTVYRSLDALAELGVLEHVHMGHGPAVYHLTHERHVHLVCRGCGVVLELTDDALTDVAAEIERTTGFVIEPSHFAINGRCADCAATT